MNELLTKKEYEIIKLRKQGMKNAEIANKLQVTDAYVSKTFKKISDKLVNASTTIEFLKKGGMIPATSKVKLTSKGKEKMKALKDNYKLTKTRRVNKIKTQTDNLKNKDLAVIKTEQMEFLSIVDNDLYHAVISKFKILPLETRIPTQHV